MQLSEKRYNLAAETAALTGEHMQTWVRDVWQVNEVEVLHSDYQRMAKKGDEDMYQSLTPRSVLTVTLTLGRQSVKVSNIHLCGGMQDDKWAMRVAANAAADEEGEAEVPDGIERRSQSNDCSTKRHNQQLLCSLRHAKCELLDRLAEHYSGGDLSIPHIVVSGEYH